MKRLNEIKKHNAGKPEGYPFKVPSGYFDTFDERLKQRMEPQTRTLWMKARPFVALAAAISGVALVTFTILQFVLGPWAGQTDEFDIALLEEAGAIRNELILMEALEEADQEEDAAFTEWEEEAMNYLASNEVDLESLINELN